MIELGIDPGASTGWCLTRRSDLEPLTVLDHGVIPDGVQGFMSWFGPEVYGDLDRVVCEKFVIDGTITGTWAPQVEGALMTMWSGEIVWQSRDDKAALLQGVPQRNRWLKQRGVSRGWKQHDKDALIHLLVKAKRDRHLPTLTRWWKNGNEEGIN